MNGRVRLARSGTISKCAIWQDIRLWLLLSLLLIAICLQLTGCSLLSREGAGPRGVALDDKIQKVALMLPLHGKWSREAEQVYQGVQGRFYAEVGREARRESDPPSPWVISSVSEQKQLQILDSSSAATVVLYRAINQTGDRRD